MLTKEMMRATINRSLVANQIGAEGYDAICHNRIDKQSQPPQGTCPPKILKLLFKRRESW